VATWRLGCIDELNEAHLVARCLAHNQRALQQVTSSTLELLGLRHDQRIATRAHASSRAWASAAALHGTCHEALARTAHHEARQACLTFRCNTNIYLPENALRMGNVYPSKLCQHPACLLACNSLEHKAFSCSQATAARLRSDTLRAIRSELDLYKMSSTGAEPLAVFRAAAMVITEVSTDFSNAQFPPTSVADASTLRCPPWHGNISDKLCLLRETNLCNLAFWRTGSPEGQQPKLALIHKQTTQ